MYLFCNMKVIKFVFHFLRDDWVLVGLCYPSDTTFQIMADINDRQSNSFDDLTDYGTVSSLTELEKKQTERKYFFDQSVGWENYIQCIEITFFTTFTQWVIPHLLNNMLFVKVGSD